MNIDRYFVPITTIDSFVIYDLIQISYLYSDNPSSFSYPVADLHPV